MVSCRSWTLRICFAVRSCRSLILIFHFAVVSCGSWTLMICFAVRSCRSSILIFHFTVVSCGSWTLRICFAVRSCRSWILIFHFAVVSCGSWTFEDLFCHEILQILDLEVSVCRRILWILGSYYLATAQVWIQPYHSYESNLDLYLFFCWRLRMGALNPKGQGMP